MPNHLSRSQLDELVADVAESLGVPSGVFQNFKRTSLVARWPSFVLGYYRDTMYQLDIGGTEDILTQIRQDPQRWIERYPSLTWTLVASWLRPNEYRPIQHSARVVNVTTFVLPKMRIAMLIEEISSFDLQAVRPKLAKHRVHKLSAAIANPEDRYGREQRGRVQAVYDCVPIHTLNLDMLVTFVWMFGVSDLAALKRLLNVPVDMGLFVNYPNLAMTLFLLKRSHLARALRRVAGLLGGNHAVWPERTMLPNLPDAETRLASVAIGREFFQYAGMGYDVELDDDDRGLLALQKLFSQGEI